MKIMLGVHQTETPDWLRFGEYHFRVILITFFVTKVTTENYQT